MITIANPTPAVKTPLPKTAAERVRELATTHRAFCRHCRQGLVCSTEFDLQANADRLEQKAAEMAARALIVEVARG